MRRFNSNECCLANRLPDKSLGDLTGDGMKDHSVGPTKLLNVARFEKLLTSLAKRIAITGQQRVDLAAMHAHVSVEQETSLDDRRGQVISRCRQDRKDLLRRWDQTEEDLTAQYERRAVAGRTELNRMAAVFRTKKEDERKTIDRKYRSREHAVLAQFENRKNQPGQQNRKEVKQIEEALEPIKQHVQWARELTISRLDGLPEVGDRQPDPRRESSTDNDELLRPDSVKDSIQQINRLTRKCDDVIDEMREGTASRIVDSYYLPAAVVLLIAIWAGAAMTFVEQNRVLWAVAGIIPAAILGSAVYLVLLLPLKRITRQLYPQVEWIARDADQVAETGRAISRRVASEAMKELSDRRDAHLSAARQWKEEQLAEMEKRFASEEIESRKHLIEVLSFADKDYSRRIKEISDDFKEQAETLAQRITRSIADEDQSRNRILRDAAAERLGQHQVLLDRLRQGVQLGFGKMHSSCQRVENDFPQWATWISTQIDDRAGIDYLPIGNFQVGQYLQGLMAAKSWANQNNEPHLNDNSGGGDTSWQSPGQSERSVSTIPDLSSGLNIPDQVPLVLHRRLHSALVIQSDDESMEKAVEVAQQLLWRLLTGAPPSRSKLTLIDPLGRGQHFTSLMALSDYDPAIIGHRVWTTGDKIEARLSELAHHAEDVLQTSLRDRFARIEDYNEAAGAMAVPYRGVAAVGFPNGLSREAYKHLQAIIDSGLRCGVFTILVCNSNQAWPSDTPVPSGEKVMKLRVSHTDGWQVESGGVRKLGFVPFSSPPPSVRKMLVEKIGRLAKEASRVEVPLESLLENTPEASGCTGAGIEIAIGSQGASRSLSMKLGEGVRQHVLIAGKTGSGKSTLLHSIITSAAYRYRPDQLNFYLLDFKKGVEFKVYAESGLPHVRVIGIESEREFGRSVLQRLDQEMQTRGEAFRDANTQELDQFRKRSGNQMPRIMLVIDEFQELFVRDDRLAGDCAMLLDRLVRQGRSFGMHVVLSSQSLAGAYSLPRATLGQMAVRIAMQCSESDAALILSDDNTAARLITKPGEAIYNDAGGLIEGNQPFQVAWLSPTRHREILRWVATRDQPQTNRLGPAVIFEGNRPCRWSDALADAALAQKTRSGDLVGLLGESVAIGPPVAISLSPDAGRNVLVVASQPASTRVMLTIITAMIKSANQKLNLVLFDGSRKDKDDVSIADWMNDAGIDFQSIKPRGSEIEMVRISGLVKERLSRHENDDEDKTPPPLLVVIDSLDRFRDLRPDETYNFSLDAAAAETGSAALQAVLKDGPPAGVFVMVGISGAETFARWLPRSSQHDLELRILGQMNANDSAVLMDSPAASELTDATMILHDNADGQITKFRQCDLPAPKAVQAWMD